MIRLRIYWRVKYLANRSVIVVGITLIWRKAVAAVHIIAIYEAYLNLADGLSNHQIKITTK